MSKRVYIAGPISTGDLRHNVLQATEAFIRLAKAGLSPWCPHWSVVSECRFKWDSNYGDWMRATAHGHRDMTHADWIRIDLAWVEVADAVLRLPGESKGGDLETAHATAKGIPVYHDIAKLIEDMA